MKIRRNRHYRNCKEPAVSEQETSCQVTALCISRNTPRAYMRGMDAHASLAFLDMKGAAVFRFALRDIYARLRLFRNSCAFLPYGRKALFDFLEVDMAEKRLTREACIALLREKQELLARDGQDRYPQRSDFDNNEVVAIKAHLGPWPRALEVSGLKPTKEQDIKKHG